MRYSTFLVVVWFLTAGALGSSWAQQPEQVVRQQITWNGYIEAGSRMGQLRKVPMFKDALFGSGEQYPSFQVRIIGRVSQGTVRNAVYEAFSPADAKLFDGINLPATATTTVTTGTEQRRHVSFARIPAVRRNAQSGLAEKLVSFEYAYSLATEQGRPAGTQARTYAKSSVLAQGDWFRIGVANSGIYKLDKKALESMGIITQGLDPRRLQIYGNAMGTLPQANSAYRPDDLAQNAIFVAGEADNSFDDADYILFYARGPHTWSLDTNSTTRRFKHELNAYVDTAYYFVTVGNAPGLRVGTPRTVSGTPTATINQFLDRQFYERELVNLAKSGRQWLGEGFTNNSPAREFTIPTPDLVPGATLQLTSQVVAASAMGMPTSFQVALNGSTLGTQQISGFSNSPQDYPEVANSSLQTFSYAVPSAPVAQARVRLVFSSPTDASGQGYLDYLEVNAPRRLRLSGNLLEFNSLPGAPISEFQLGAGSGTTVWDVSNPRQPVSLALNGSGNFVARTDSVGEFVAFTGSDFPAPPRLFKNRIANQNLHARLNLNGKLDLVIVTYPPFKPEADRLAAYRRSHDKLNVEVVTTTEVYNEFSSGGQDVTAIRDMMKMVYDRSTSGKQLYLLLFGDASYDYKSDPTNNMDLVPDWWQQRSPLDADKNAQNYVPTYESRESFALVTSRANSKGVTFCSDDYFGLLDDNEGEWDEGYSNDLLDIGIGRLPIRTPRGQSRSLTQATLVVNKLIRYDEPVSFGKWRNRITFVADDGNGSIFIRDACEPQALSVIADHPEFNIHKVYLDLYPQTIASGGQRSPECNRAIDESIEQGSLIVHYSGHGGPKGWADEQILTKQSVLALQNRNRLTFMVTGTCDFSTYDNPEEDSAGELALTDVEGGAIGLLTTTRLALAHETVSVSSQLYNTIFKPTNGQMSRLGDVTQFSKNNGSRSTSARNYVLLGDPTTRLAAAEQEAVLDSINGSSITAVSLDTLKALSKVKLSGLIKNGQTINSQFSGQAHVTVYEKPTTVNTLKNEFDDVVLTVPIQENIIYDGQATVKNGRFKFNFVVPKDINYSVGLGKIQLYAKDSVRIVDANGHRPTYVGGAATLTQQDSIPPLIKLFMDRESFVFGGVTGTTTTLISHLSDASGINTAGAGIGHEITATLDNDPTKLTVLNDFYTADVDSYQSGKVKYLFKDLATGPHVLRLKAWDTFNNSAQQEIEFIAASTEKLALEHVLNYPNPFSTKTTFQFDHNRTTDDLDVQVQIFTISGRLVRTLRTTILASGPHVGRDLDALTWNGRDEYEDQLARGVYVYRVSVRSHRDNATASKFEKLVILN
ncbi:type IX secretion system sortase PorU [Hymenobacter cellulosivorans]|uniref:Type IX secretion system sortase PorU n=1 Tax=Hymenobacter cellulosivorans TaxID=2932249 RepID=A0ABY4FE18_9BACT|nr:type IX secretion system sortase PorU [Hymenobacter cellulosivorans]UOQ54650.1 type IX secretion system sortase PorU [Hymenobacter cellulosivorans]